MDLLHVDTVVKERFIESELFQVCRVVNDLEQRLVCEIFSPCGIEVRATPLNFRDDAHTPLLLGDEHLMLYVYYVFWIFSITEMDLEAANAYSSLFYEKYNKLAVFYRRKYAPIKNPKLTGRI